MKKCLKKKKTKKLRTKKTNIKENRKFEMVSSVNGHLWLWSGGFKIGWKYETKKKKQNKKAFELYLNRKERHD